MPAAAVIPAPIAYIKVVAVKKLVVGFRVGVAGPPLARCALAAAVLPAGDELLAFTGRDAELGDVYFEKIRVFKAGSTLLNTLAWNNEIGLWSILLVCGTGVMINRDSWGYSYLIVRGEILGFMKDELLRKHLPRMFSLIKNES